MQYSVKTTLAAGLILAGEAMALDRISIKGSKFFYPNGTQFFMKGIAYQQEVGAAGSSSTSTTYTDPLADETSCKRDIEIMKKAGTNTIRTYAIDPTKDHSACMSALSDAGIYVVSDLSEPALSINRDTPVWNTALATRYYNVIDELSKYDNVIGFFAGNEVTNDKNNTDASAFVKAAVRDSKAYIADKGYSTYVGYAANDDPNVRSDIAHYFNCGEVSDAIDFWGYNIYSWCGESTLQKSGYDKQIEFFKNYSVPVFFAEYGCNEVGGADGRIWQETTALYESEMTEVFSGGIVYMFHQEANDYGLVEVKDGEATPMENFDKLAEVATAANPTGVSADDYNPSNSPAACPALSDNWKASEILPPTPDNATCECMEASLSCGPADSLDEEDFGDIFGYICGSSPESCVGINTDAANGIYGAYSMCTSRQQLGFVLDAYYTAQNKASTACDFDGKAQTLKASATTSDCKSKLSAAQTEDGGGCALGVRLFYGGEVDGRKKRVVQRVLEKARGRFGVSPEFLPDITTLDGPGTSDSVTTGLISQSLNQNQTLFHSENLSIFALDRTYTFKCAQRSYSIHRHPTRLDDAITELRLLFLAKNRTTTSLGHIQRSFDGIRVDEVALVDILNGYLERYGEEGMQGVSGLKRRVAEQEARRRPFIPLDEKISLSEKFAALGWSTLPEAGDLEIPSPTDSLPSIPPPTLKRSYTPIHLTLPTPPKRNLIPVRPVSFIPLAPTSAKPPPCILSTTPRSLTALPKLIIPNRPPLGVNAPLSLPTNTNTNVIKTPQLPSRFSITPSTTTATAPGTNQTTPVPLPPPLLLPNQTPTTALATNFYKIPPMTKDPPVALETPTYTAIYPSLTTWGMLPRHDTPGWDSISLHPAVTAEDFSPTTRGEWGKLVPQLAPRTVGITTFVS